MLRSTRGLRSLGAQMRSTKSGPGRCSCSFGTVWHLCSSRSDASSPRISSIRVSGPVAVAMVLLLFLFPPPKSGGRRGAAGERVLYRVVLSLYLHLVSPTGRVLDQGFFARDTVVVANDLLGKL